MKPRYVSGSGLKWCPQLSRSFIKVGEILGDSKGSISVKVKTDLIHICCRLCRKIISLENFWNQSSLLKEIWLLWKVSPTQFLLVLIWSICYIKTNKNIIQLACIGLPNRTTTLQFMWQESLKGSANWTLPCSLACEFSSRKNTRQESLSPVTPFPGYSKLFYYGTI